MLAGLFYVPCKADAVILDASGDPSFNTTAPTGPLEGSGWQYLGLWNGVLGTPVAPEWFLTAKHVGGSIGQAFTFAGANYTTVEVVNDPASDLSFWRVADPFPTWASIYTKNDEQDEMLTVFGRGTQRGEEVRNGEGELRGWLWGAADGQVRWGTNEVSGIYQGGPGLGELLYVEFNHIGGSEAHLSVGDSGGPVFIQDSTDGVWKLAAINYAVSGPFYRDAQGGGAFQGALFETGGFYRQAGSGYVPILGPTAFFSTRLSTRQELISSIIVPEPSSLSLLLFGILSGAGLARRRGRDRLRETRATVPPAARQST